MWEICTHRSAVFASVWQHRAPSNKSRCCINTTHVLQHSGTAEHNLPKVLYSAKNQTQKFNFSGCFLVLCFTAYLSVMHFCSMHAYISITTTLLPHVATNDWHDWHLTFFIPVSACSLFLRALYLLIVFLFKLIHLQKSSETIMPMGFIVASELIPQR